MHHRCNICDRTNTREVTTMEEQYFKGPYFDDPQADGELCQECIDAINDTVSDDEDLHDIVHPFNS